MSTVIAIDGPAASGKGTLARRLARHFGYFHLDTGLLYRATASRLLQEGANLKDETMAAAVAANLTEEDLADPDLPRHEIGEAASKIAVLPKVRSALFDFQQAFAAREPGSVLDGRDISSVICPNADLKFFVTASQNVRAGRRHKEIVARGHDLSFEEVLCDIKRRDERDQNRDVAPLIPSADAHLIDTSEMDIETAFQAILAIADQKGL